MDKKCKYCNSILTDSNWVLSFKIKNMQCCKSCHNKNTSKRRSNQYFGYKKSIFNKLGDRCNCCGQQDQDLLSIDHIYGGGMQEKEIHSGRKYLRHLNKLPLEELKSKYQILCYNCNYTKGFYKQCCHVNKKYDLGIIKKEAKQKKLSRLKLKIENINF